MAEWYETVINDLDVDDCLLVVCVSENSCHSRVYTVNNHERTDYSGWNHKTNGKSPHDKYQSFLLAMMNETDKGIHVYRYEHNRLAEYRKFTNYDFQLYDGWAEYVLLFQEYGLQPVSQSGKENLQKVIKNAEKTEKSLVYACYLNQTDLIVERAAGASKTQLNRNFNLISNPLGFCAKNRNLTGFKAIAERGADINKSCAGMTPLQWAYCDSPDIVLYVYDNFREAFDRDWQKRKGNLNTLNQCTDLRLFELFRDYGSDMSMNEDDWPPLHNFVMYNNPVGVQFLADNGVDFRNIRNHQKQTALEFAEQRGIKNNACELLKKLTDEKTGQ